MVSNIVGFVASVIVGSSLTEPRSSARLVVAFDPNETTSRFSVRNFRLGTLVRHIRGLPNRRRELEQIAIETILERGWQPVRGAFVYF